MNKDTIITQKKVGDPVNVGVIEDEIGVVVIHGQPTFVINPLDGKRINIKYIMKTDRDTTCPKCQKVNGPGINMRVLVNEMIVYECPLCKHFTFCKVHEDKKYPF